jgi:hypothetical protein
MGKRRQICTIIFFSFCLAGLVGTAPTFRVKAGVNGQHLAIKVCNEPVPSQTGYWIEVAGYNQNNVRTYWYSSKSGAFSGACNFYTSNYWWVGRVTVTVVKRELGHLTSRVANYSVPRVQSGDWYYVSPLL